MPHHSCPFLTKGKAPSTLKPRIARPSLVEGGRCKDATLALKSGTLMLTLCVDITTHFILLRAFYKNRKAQIASKQILRLMIYYGFEPNSSHVLKNAQIDR